MVVGQVMIYEVKSSAVYNYKNLFSDDSNYFYWNALKFKNLNIGDYVFVINKHNNEVMLTKLDIQNIDITFSGEFTLFNDLGKTFKVSGYWDNFIRLEIIERVKTNSDWLWKTLGSSETSYLNGNRVGLQGSINRQTNINQLKSLSATNLWVSILEICETNFNNTLPVEVVGIMDDITPIKTMVYRVVDETLGWRTLSVNWDGDKFSYNLYEEMEEITYIIHNPASNIIKIGKTIDLDKRMKQHRTALPNFELLIIFPKSQYSESYLHKKFADFHHELEWYYYVRGVKELINSELDKQKALLDCFRRNSELKLLEEKMLNKF